MLTKKNPKKMHVNLIKYQVENCLALLGRNLISTCNRRVKSVSSGQVEISSRQAGSCNHHLNPIEHKTKIKSNIVSIEKPLYTEHEYQALPRFFINE